MSYSLSVRYSTQAERDAALAKVEAWDWELIRAQAPDWQFSAPVAGKDLSYPPAVDSNLLLGFNRPILTSLEWTVTVWLACKSAYRDQDGNPVIFFDDEALPIVFGREPKPGERLHIWADSQGLMDTSRQSWLRRLLLRHERKWLRNFLTQQA